MGNEVGNQRLSANFLEKVEDDLEANPGKPLFEGLSEADYNIASEKLRVAVPQLINAYRNRILSGREDRSIDPNFLERLSEAAADKLDPKFDGTDSQAQNMAQKLRDSLPILINAYRLEFGLPMRMR